MQLKQDNIFSRAILNIYIVTVLFYTIVYMVLILLPFYIHENNSSFIELGFVMGISMLTSMVCRPYAGRIIDKYGSSYTFYIALIVFALSLTLYFTSSTIIYWVARLIQGAVAAFFSTAMEIITINLLSDKIRGQGLSLYSLSTVIPTVFAPVLVFYLMQHLQDKTIFIILYIIGVANFIIAYPLFKISKTLEVAKGETQHHSFKQFITNMKYLNPTLIMLLASVANGAIFSFLPLYLTSINSSFIKTYFLIQMLTLVITRFIGAKALKLNDIVPIKLLYGLVIAVLCSFIIISFYPHPWLLTLAAIANGFSFALLYPTLLTIMSFRIKSLHKGFYLAIFIAGADFGFSMGAILFGVIAQLLSLRSGFIFCTALLAVTLPCCYYLNQEQKTSTQS